VTWRKTPQDRQRDAKVYGPEYRLNRAAVMRAAAGRCAECHHRHARLQCDHVIPVTQGGSHAVSNLRAVCVGDGSCRCHERKTAGEGRGYRANSGSNSDGEPGRKRIAADPEPNPDVWW
jgi:5-methylcytosine-specific restriction endonuclease McrA